MIDKRFRHASRAALDELGFQLGFPLNGVMLKNLDKEFEITIYYCIKGLMNREVYIETSLNNLNKLSPKDGYCQHYL